MTEEVILGLDYSHNNILTLESSSFSEFTQFLFTSGYKIGQIKSGFNSLSDLKKYKVIILSTPKNIKLKPEEIENIESYIKNGGSLLITSSSGGDYTNRTNLNELTRKFGFEFGYDEINDSVNFVNLQKRPIITRFTPHVITDQIKKIVFSSSCSTQIIDFADADKNIKVDGILQSGLNCWRKKHNGEDWIEEDCPKIPILVAVEYYKGKVVGFGNISIFSSLAREYGFSALDNDILIANILNWLIGSIESKGKAVTVDLNLDLFYWTQDIVKNEKWENLSDLINISLKYFKDNYREIMESLKKIQQDKVERQKAYKKAREEERREQKVLEKLPKDERKKEDLEEIIDALEEITGEKYELSIDFKEDDNNKYLDEETGLRFSEEDIEEFEKLYSKNAIWGGKTTITFREWLENKYKNKE